jgi:hypothetical protein
MNTVAPGETNLLGNVKCAVLLWTRSILRSAPITAFSCTILLMSLSAAFATGPNNQVVPNPATAGFNTLSSVVAVENVTGGVIVGSGTGSGTVIDSYVNPSTNIGYLCVLTADHVVTGGANMISFPNVTLGAAPPAAGTYPIIARQQVAGIGVGQNVDANVVLVQYGAPDAFYFGVPDKSLVTSVGVGNQLSEVGFGVTATPNFTGANLTSLTQQASATYGTKRYQNNLLTAFVPNNIHGAYKENDVTYTFDAQGTPNFIAGEGFGFPGDSGAPLFNNTTTFDPGGGLPLVDATDSIAGVDVFGPTGTIANGAVELTVDVFDYSANIETACATVMAAVPEPSAALLLSVSSVCVCLACRHRRLAR